MSDEQSFHNNSHGEQSQPSAKPDGNGGASTFGSLRESARVTTDAICDVGSKASAVIKEFGDGAYQLGQNTGASVVRQVEAQPMTAALVAASLGLIVGVLLPRR